ncbi:MAG: methyltransferase domain-containing protein [Thermomicrobiales bacterium]
MPFDDDTFDAARVDRVLQHVDDPVQVLSEMVRVVKPAGRIAASDPDFSTRRVTTSYPNLEWRIETWWQEWRDRMPGSGSRGRYLYEHFLDAGIVDVEIQSAAPVGNDLTNADGMMGVIVNARRAAEAGAITPEELEMWERDLQDRAERGRFLMTFVGFLVHGRVQHSVQPE